MKTIYFVSTNKRKIQLALSVCTNANITMKSIALDIDEIQSENMEVIIKNKVYSAYNQLSSPVVVTDIAWSIRALNGFPGPYMKSINTWFKPEDFIRLMDGVEDRRVIMHQYLAYYDGKITKIFNTNISGTIIDRVRGINLKSPNTTVTVLDTDNDKTIAEVYELGINESELRYKNREDVWKKFADWYKKQ
jgi:XTP/dITP diphosphohydrolase